MANLPTIFGGIASYHDGRVHCIKCNRQVDSVTIETPVDDAGERDGYVVKEKTGEIILTVECHGEKWMASNWHGRLA